LQANAENLKHETGFVQQNPGNQRADGRVQKGMGRWATAYTGSAQK
jgi:hypothetical protein